MQTANDVTSRILTEDALTLKEAQLAIHEATGRKLDKTTLYRWCLRGAFGVRLEHVRLGQQIITSRQALTRFIEAQTTIQTTAAGKPR